MEAIEIYVIVVFGIIVYATLGVVVGSAIESTRCVRNIELTIIVLWPIEALLMFTHSLVRGIKREFRYWRATWGK